MIKRYHIREKEDIREMCMEKDTVEFVVIFIEM